MKQLLKCIALPRDITMFITKIEKDFFPVTEMIIDQFIELEPWGMVISHRFD